MCQARQQEACRSSALRAPRPVVGRGVESNRGGLGARLIARAGALAQTRELSAGDGLTQDEGGVYFGLGEYPRVDELEVGWPSGCWDGRDGDGRELVSGVYLYRLRLGERVEARKLVLVR